MTVLARTRQEEVLLGGHGSLMYQCLVAGFPVASSCAGRGACGRCVVQVLEGLDTLTPPDAHECLVLARNRAAPDERLSCQSRLRFSAARVVITTGYW